MAFDRFRRMFGREEEDFVGSGESSSEFIEIDLEQEKSDSRIYIKTFVLRDYDDVNAVLSALREGYSIVVIDIRPLKQKDVVELKRAISKVKKTVEALEGKIAGFGENTVIATPSKVFDIQKGATAPVQERSRNDVDMF